MKKSILFFCLLALSGLFLSGCATAPPALLSLNYNVPPGETSTKTNISVAMVKPKFISGKSSQMAALSIQSTAMGSIINSSLQDYTPPDFLINDKYGHDYSFRIQNSMMNDMELILKRKGFNIVSLFDSMDEIPYAEKKRISLILEPTFDFGPQVFNKRERVPVVGYSDSGTIQLLGKLKISFIEPLSKEVILAKSVDVSALGVNYSSTYETRNSAVDSFTRLLNGIYPFLMTKVAAVIDPEEVKTSLKDIARLKEKNQ